MKRGYMLLIAILLIGDALPAQVTVVPQGFKYQAVARDAANKPYVNTDIRLAAALKDGGLLGTIYYEEEHDVTTTDLGLINLTIGQGVPVSGSFDAVPWAGGQINLVIRLSLDGGFTWTPMGESPLLAVPYAQMAETAQRLVDFPGFIADSLGQTSVSTVDIPDLITFRLNGTIQANLVNRSAYLPVLELYDKTNHDNLGIGQLALSQFQPGAEGNTALGIRALSLNSTGNYNSAFGAWTLKNNTTGIENTGVGAYTLTSNTGSYNTAIGSAAMQTNTTGVRNASVGFQSLFWNIAGDANTAIGTEALFHSSYGSENTVVGYRAAYGPGWWPPIGGYRNTAAGAYSLMALDTGSYNTGIGALSLYHTSGAQGNTALGVESLFSNQTGNFNTAIGYLACYRNQTHHSTAVGYKSLFANIWGYANTALGAESLLSNIAGNGNTAIGADALRAHIGDGYNTAVGLEAMRMNETGSHNVAIGCAALRNTRGISAQVAVGDSALYHNMNGYTNTALGYGAGIKNIDGFGNTAIGFSALRNNIYGHFNTALGREAGPPANATLVNTTALGAGAQPTASNQVIIGNASVTEIGGFTNWSNLSDSRFKVDIMDNVPGLAFINQLRPVTYLLDMAALSNTLEEDRLTRSSTGEQDHEALALLGALQTMKGQIRYSGFIAQDVEKAAAQVGYDFSGVDKPQNENDFYALRYAEFVVPLVKAIQEQQAQIEALQAENAQLRAAVGEIETLRAAIEELQWAQHQK